MSGSSSVLDELQQVKKVNALIFGCLVPKSMRGLEKDASVRSGDNLRCSPCKNTKLMLVQRVGPTRLRERLHARRYLYLAKTAGVESEDPGY